MDIKTPEDFAALSRRRLLTGAAVLGGALLCSHPRHWARSLAAQPAAQPVPIPNHDRDQEGPPHFFFPGRGKEPSTIYDFNGIVAVANAGGEGRDQAGNRLLLDFDNRVMSGQFVAADGSRHRGSFAFI